MLLPRFCKGSDSGVEAALDGPKRNPQRLGYLVVTHPLEISQQNNLPKVMRQPVDGEAYGVLKFLPIQRFFKGRDFSL